METKFRQNPKGNKNDQQRVYGCPEKTRLTCAEKERNYPTRLYVMCDPSGECIFAVSLDPFQEKIEKETRLFQYDLLRDRRETHNVLLLFPKVKLAVAREKPLTKRKWVDFEILVKKRKVWLQSIPPSSSSFSVVERYLNFDFLPLAHDLRLLLLQFSSDFYVYKHLDQLSYEWQSSINRFSFCVPDSIFTRFYNCDQVREYGSCTFRLRHVSKSPIQTARIGPEELRYFHSNTVRSFYNRECLEEYHLEINPTIPQRKKYVLFGSPQMYTICASYPSSKGFKFSICFKNNETEKYDLSLDTFLNSENGQTIKWKFDFLR